MTKTKGNENPEPKDKLAIVYRSVSQTAKEHVYSFTISQEQSDFIKAHRKTINFSDTFRKYLDSIIEAVKKEEIEKH